MAYIPISKATNAYELLGEIADLIVQEPLRYDQTDTLRVGHGDMFPDCGTVGCVAGWTVVLKGGQTPEEAQWCGVMGTARGILGLSPSQADDLFDGLAVSKDMSPQTKDHAEAGAAHIRRFMEKHAKQLKAKKFSKSTRTVGVAKPHPKHRKGDASAVNKAWQ